MERKVQLSCPRDKLDFLVLGQGFNGITDIGVGLDRYLYIVSFGNGEIYRIVPR